MASSLSVDSWREFWDGKHDIYVNEAHKRVHSEAIMQDLCASFNKNETVLDFGCGEMPILEPLVSKAKTLYLCDGAPSVLEGLKNRTNAACLLPEQLQSIENHSIDKIFVVSVVQYLSHQELTARLADFKRLLAPNGVIFLADIIPPHVGIIEDTKSLLIFGIKHGFFIAACLGLVKTLFSPYRKLRASYGLTKFSKQELLEFVAKNGLQGEILAHNIGPHQHRFTVKVTL